MSSVKVDDELSKNKGIVRPLKNKLAQAYGPSKAGTRARTFFFVL
jgi:hypothetical protein